MTSAVKKKNGFFQSIRESAKTLKTLVKMQLREKMDLGRSRSLRKTIFKIVWLFVEFIVITVGITLAFR